MENNKTIKIGRLLAKVRSVKRLSQEDVEWASHISRKTISNLENDEQIPNLYTFGKLAKALGMKPSDLLIEIEKNTNYLLVIDQETEEKD
ncbi:helix-turn-helix domain-containing protein [Bacillus sp. OK048]|uniref:helix-turn-helix domain-containing protein n=1 Tax=Bacillus sp. OK048 TaxID=1882761 RepID=UPI00088945C9|nr:helix-turn-helix transcriptional regulator [Bacillus sp. OK048]SDN05934.1 DNA-binding transcriptional regulator, XRE-family HTH domain [Bacillus sp. OK048]